MEQKSNFTTNHLIAICRAQFSFIIKIIGIVMLITIGVTLIIPKTYTASSNVFVDYRGADPISGYLFSSSADSSYLQTQIDILQSQAVAQRVIDSLNLLKTAKYQESVDKYGKEKAQNNLIKKINENTTIQTHSSSRVIEVFYNGKTPEAARDFVNAIVKSYIEFSQEMSNASARSRREQYSAELENLRNTADELQKKLTEAQQQYGIIDLNEQTDLQTRQLNDLTNSLNQVNSQLFAAQSRNETFKRFKQQGIAVDEIPDIAQMPNINDLKSKLSIVNASLSDAQSVLGAAHPKVIALVHQRNDLLGRIRQEAQTAINYQEQEVNRLQAQKKSFEDAIANQSKIVMENKNHRDTVLSYQRQLDSINHSYNSAIQRYDEVVMAGNVAVSNITVLRPAQLPNSASKPVLLNNLAAGLIFGILISICLALLREFTHRKVRIQQDMTIALNIPLLGTIGTQTKEAI